MATPEFYTSVTAISVPTIFHTQLEGIQTTASDIRVCPTVLEACSLVSVKPEGVPEGAEVFNSSLRRVSRFHGRSLLVTQPTEEPEIFSDQFGNPYSVFTAKGDILDYPYPFRSSTAPTGYAINGLQDSSSMVRIIKASNYLRSQRVETEAIVGVAEPQEFPLDGQMVSVNQFKSEFMRRVWAANQEENPADKRFANIPEQKILELMDFLEQNSLLITLRAMQVPVRLSDFMEAETKEDFQFLLGEVFRYINAFERRKVMDDPSYQGSFLNPGDDEDVKKYFLKYLPTKSAETLGKAHRSGVVFVFPHAGNVSGVGSVYDLDSAKGFPIDEKDLYITDNEISKDLVEFMSGTDHSDGVDQVLIDLTKKGFLKTSATEAMEKFRHSFYRRYVDIRGWQFVDSEGKDIFDVLDKFGHQAYTFFRNKLLLKMAEEGGLDYSYTPDTPKLMYQFVKSYAEDYVEPDKVDVAKHTERLAPGDFDPQFKVRAYLTLEAMYDLGTKYKTQIDQFNERHGTIDMGSLHYLLVRRAVDSALRRMDADLRGEALVLPEEQRKPGSVVHAEIIRLLSLMGGWDKNVLKNIVYIYELHDRFQGNDEALLYYSSKITEEAGFDFVTPDTLESLTQKFHRHDQRRLEKEIAGLAPRISPEGLFETLMDMQDARRHEEFGEIIDGRFDLFLIDTFGRQIKQQLDTQLVDISDQYDPLTAGTIMHMLMAKEGRKFNSERTPEWTRALVERSSKRMERLSTRLVLKYMDRLSRVQLRLVS